MTPDIEQVSLDQVKDRIKERTRQSPPTFQSFDLIDGLIQIAVPFLSLGVLAIGGPLPGVPLIVSILLSLISFVIPAKHREVSEIVRSSAIVFCALGYAVLLGLAGLNLLKMASMFLGVQHFHNI